MNSTWIILLLLLFYQNNGNQCMKCECKPTKKCECSCVEREKTNKCGCEENTSPFPIFNGQGSSTNSGCGCDS